jgi:hypothetical protein
LTANHLTGNPAPLSLKKGLVCRLLFTDMLGDYIPSDPLHIVIELSYVIHKLICTAQCKKPIRKSAAHGVLAVSPILIVGAVGPEKVIERFSDRSATKSPISRSQKNWSTYEPDGDSPCFRLHPCVD